MNIDYHEGGRIDEDEYSIIGHPIAQRNLAVTIDYHEGGILDNEYLMRMNTHRPAHWQRNLVNGID